MLKWPFPHMAHGGDYNPDQWRHIPGTFEEDLKLMKKSGTNMVSVGIFSWSALEPSEGVYDMDWLQNVLDGLHANGVSAVLATPSGARPPWMSQKYPEVLRVNEEGSRNLHGVRHNHCFTSPVYREFVRKINGELARRFGDHPAVVGWHISNEYSGTCHCELCQAAFREYLKARYETLDGLNKAWWTGFWSNIFSDWEQIHSPVPRGETSLLGLKLDWKRFTTHQTIDFMRHEVEAVRACAPAKPVTANFMCSPPFEGLDYFKFRDVMDVASWDSYPLWGSKSNVEVALDTGFIFDLCRSILGKPWLLLESTPSMTNWMPVAKNKRPGVHLASAMQAIAHGSDSVMMFQWRKSRGSAEKMHGAVVGHDGGGDTRVFRDVAQVGEYLSKLDELVGAPTKAQAAVVYDWENKWALEAVPGVRRKKEYDETVQEHYSAIKRQGVDVDVIDSEYSFVGYKVLVAPMLYMVKPGLAAKLEAFARAGGTVVLTHLTGIADQSDLNFLGGAPGPLRALAGVYCEETDACHPGEENCLVPLAGNTLGLEGSYRCGFINDLIKAETAKVEAVYGADFYSGSPALTVNSWGEGKCWYLATRAETGMLFDFYSRILPGAGVEGLLPQCPPEGVLVTSRKGDKGEVLFLINFAEEMRTLDIPQGQDLIAGISKGGRISMKPYEVLILRV